MHMRAAGGGGGGAIGRQGASGGAKAAGRRRFVEAKQMQPSTHPPHLGVFPHICRLMGRQSVAPVMIVLCRSRWGPAVHHTVLPAAQVAIEAVRLPRPPPPCRQGILHANIQRGGILSRRLEVIAKAVAAGARTRSGAGPGRWRGRRRSGNVDGEGAAGQVPLRWRGQPAAHSPMALNPRPPAQQKQQRLLRVFIFSFLGLRQLWAGAGRQGTGASHSPQRGQTCWQLHHFEPIEARQGRGLVAA